MVSWVPAGADEQLYLSPESAFAAGQAVRGGVPVIFPQFNTRGPLQRHGFARNKAWQIVLAQQRADEALAVLQLRDDAATRASWPHAFGLELRVRIGTAWLEITLSCQNQGHAPLTFTGALHTYLRVDTLAGVGLHGLAGLQYWDAVADSTRIEREESLQPGGDLDRVYYGVDRDLLLRESRGRHERRLQIHQQGFEDVVVWNPGAAKCAALPDMPADGYRNMVCVEAARITRPVQLAARASWSGMQKLSLL